MVEEERPLLLIIVRSSFSFYLPCSLPFKWKTVLLLLWINYLFNRELNGVDFHSAGVIAADLQRDGLPGAVAGDGHLH